MARKRIEVILTPDEHESLSTYVAHGHKSAREINRARIFLLAHDGHTDADIAKVLGVSHVTISKRLFEKFRPPRADATLDAS